MTVALPRLALSLLWLLQAEAEVLMQLDFDAEKVMAQATASNCSMFLKMKDGMKSSITTISFTPEGDLAMKFVWPLLDKCQKLELLFQQSGQAGHYMGMCGQQHKRDLLVMETDYSHYEAHHSQTEPSTTLQLLTQEQNASPQVLQKFMELIPTMGLTKDMLAVLPKLGEC
ncbi:LCN15 protein, partial [Campylorhamphus procurvoides]|nr:LCN15 protein [Campylorhamphus procurvoides]